MPPAVSVIIPVFNQWRFTEQCLLSLAEHTPVDDMEILVVDNGSGDETPAACPSLGRRLFGDRFRHLRLEHNINFGPGCNYGAAQAQGRLLYFLNNDTIMTAGWLGPLLSAMAGDSALGAVGPLLLYPDVGVFQDRVQHCGITFKPQFYPAHMYEYFPADHPLVRKKRRYQALTGAAFLVPAELFSQVGRFHEGYINGGEDVDLSLQIKNAGYGLSCVADSAVYHLTSQTPGRNLHEMRNAATLKERCVGSIVPDYHYYGAQDGYELALTPWLSASLQLPERRKRIIEKRFRADFDLDECLETLHREPLWLEGYDLAARHCRQNGDGRMLVSLLFLKSKFLHHRDCYVELQKAAELHQDAAMADYASRQLGWFNEEITFREIEESAESMAAFLAGYGDEKLTAPYVDWLSRRDEIRKTFFSDAAAGDL